jgi:hypothetical protein
VVQIDRSIAFPIINTGYEQNNTDENIKIVGTREKAEKNRQTRPDRSSKAFSAQSSAIEISENLL